MRTVLRMAVVSLAMVSTMLGAEVPKVGTMAPGFRLASQDGTPVALSDFRGKWVVLYFYPKDGTPGCTIEAHNFQRDLPQYEKLNSVIVGVSVDSAGSHKEFCAKQGLTFKLLADTEKTVAKQYGSLSNFVVMKLASRHTFLVDPAGRIAKVWTDVTPSSHSAEVLAAVRQMAGGKR
ncbi:MAG: hypothetical protein RL328_1623 [Acidobacteriota bacterium]